VNVVTVPPTATTSEIAMILAESASSNVPVCEADGTLLGIGRRSRSDAVSGKRAGTMARVVVPLSHSGQQPGARPSEPHEKRAGLPHGS